MSDVVFVLGAGASRAAGGPLMNDFLDRARDLYAGHLSPATKLHFDRVFGAISSLQQVHSKADLDLQNIESIFTAFELAKVIRTFPGKPCNEIEECITSLKQLIVTTIEESISFPLSASDHLRAPKGYSEFLELVKELKYERDPPLSVSIITFNYDLCIDVSFSQQQFNLQYGLEKACAKDFRQDDNVDVLKLHGSLNWARETTSQKIVAVPVTTWAKTGYKRSARGTDVNLRIGSNISNAAHAYNSDSEFENQPVIVPPSWNKADYHSALSNVWERAAAHLSEAEFVFVMGYSLPLTDSFFRHLFALGSVGDKLHRRVEVFDPGVSNNEINGIDDRFRNLLGKASLSRYCAHSLTFKDAIDYLRSKKKI